MIDVNRKKIVLAVLFALLLLFGIGGAFYYFQYSERKSQQLFLQRYEQSINSYRSLTPENVDFKKTADELGMLLKDSRISGLNLQEIGRLRIAYADSLNEIDPVEGTLVLKELAADLRYPNDVRYTAVNYIVNDYEIAPDYEFAKKYIFTGEPYKNFLQDNDVELAIRRLNEWSDEILPNVIANYRIAKWYASQIYQNPSLSPSDKNQFLNEMNDRLNKADELFSQYKNIMSNRAIGLAYELKARTIYLAGESGYKEKTKEFFNESFKSLTSPPRSIFQAVYFTRASLYRLAFMAREYSDTQVEIERIKSNLKFLSDYLEAAQEPKQRNVRLVKFLITARDSINPKYPSPDFNQEDIKNLSRIDERFKKVIESLNYLEYIKGHPIERIEI
ncbi:MAG: hypothetical protein ABIJ19_02000 [Patescibacteria group bacterium]